MQLNQALHRLAEDSLLAAMPKQVAEQVKAAASVRKIERGGVVVLQGQPADKLIIPIDGPLRLVTRTPTDSTTYELRARRALNLGEMLAGGLWSYSAFADAEVHVIEVDANTFREVLRGAPSYARYLYRIAGLRTVRAAVGVLRRAGLHPRKIQRLLSMLEDRTVAPGGLLGEQGEPPWVLVDTGALELLRDDGGELLELTTLEPGEFYGAGAALRRAMPLQLRARETTRLLLIEANRLRALCASDEDLARVLRLEHPEVQRRVRRAFIESGQAFTDQMLAVAPSPDGADDDDDEDEVHVEAVLHTAERAAVKPATGVELPRGVTWRPPAGRARRLEGVRSALVEDSGAAALASILQYYDRTMAFASIRRALQRRSPPSLLELAQIAERQGLMTHAARLASPARMRELRAPFLLMIGQHYVVVHQVLRHSIRVFSPANGLCELAMAELEPGWSGAALSFSDVRSFMRDLAPAAEVVADAKPADGKPAPSTSGKRGAYFRLFGDVRGAMTAAVLVSLGVLALSVVGPRLSGLVVDQVIAYGDNSLLVVVAIGLVLVHFSTFLLSGFRELALAYLGGLIEHRLSSLSLRHTLGIALEAHGDDRVGAALERLNELNRIRTSISTDVIQLTLQIAKGIVYLLLVVYYSWKLGLIVAAGVPASYLIVLSTRKPYREGYVEMFEENSRMQSQTTEQVEQVATIKALGGGAAAQKRWEQTLVSKLGVERRLVRLQTWAQLAFNLIEESIRIGATYLGVKLVLGGTMSPGTLLAVTQYVTGALAPLLAIAGKLEEFAQA
ncbi:MAG TPA: ABC transporter transmembrane domain-containing protein, partial [Kofleriaceae bacterium]